MQVMYPMAKSGCLGKFQVTPDMKKVFLIWQPNFTSHFKGKILINKTMSIHFSNVFISYFCRSEISNKNLKSQEMFHKNTLNAFIVLIEII